MFERSDPHYAIANMLERIFSYFNFCFEKKDEAINRLEADMRGALNMNGDLFKFDEYSESSLSSRLMFKWLPWYKQMYGLDDFDWREKILVFFPMDLMKMVNISRNVIGV
jgi:hypothetical protein